MYSREKVLEIAKRELGVAEPRGDDKYIRWYNHTEHAGFDMDVSWCAIWCSWVLRAAEIPEELCPNFASCTVCMNWAKEHDVWHDNDYSPLPGDLVFFDWNGKGKPSHVGIVTDANSVSVFTIEGNTSNMVAERSYDKDSSKLLGYIAINYGDELPEAPAMSVPAEPVITTKKRRIADLQLMLRTEFKVTIVVDNAWGPKSKAALIKAIQKSLNDSYRSWLAVDGIWGQKTEKAWRNLQNGASGNLVLLAQMALVAHGADIDADGIFGKKTLKAVRDFQKTNNLDDDGIIGPLTMRKLVK